VRRCRSLGYVDWQCKGELIVEAGGPVKTQAAAIKCLSAFYHAVGCVEPCVAVLLGLEVCQAPSFSITSVRCGIPRCTGLIASSY
jgi:hypothetical protein